MIEARGSHGRTARSSQLRELEDVEAASKLVWAQVHPPGLLPV